MTRDITKKLKLVASIISSALIPLSILLVAYIINYFSTILSLSSDLPSNIIISIGGLSSIVLYTYLAFSEIRAFIKEEDGEFQMRSLEIDNNIKLSKQEFEKILTSKNNNVISTVEKPLFDVSTKLVNSRVLSQLAINASKHIAVATDSDPERTEVHEKVFLEVLQSAQITLNSYSASHSKSDISNHRIASIYTYWFSKLKPFVSDSLYFNEMVALKIGLAIFGKTEKDISNHLQYKNMLYHLHFRDINIDALALIFQLIESDDEKNN